MEGNPDVELDYDMDDDELDRYYRQKDKPILLNNRYIWISLHPYFNLKSQN